MEMSGGPSDECVHAKPRDGSYPLRGLLFFDNIFYMPHTCQALIVHCIDFRLQQAVPKYLEDQNILGTSDIVSVAGGVKNLDFVMSQVEISKRLHNINKIILMNHTDCGAYGGKSAFTNEAEEFSKHSHDLKDARNEIQAKFPDLQVKTLLAKITQQGIEIVTL